MGMSTATASTTTGRRLAVVRPHDAEAARRQALEKARRARRELEARSDRAERFAHLRRSYD